MDVGAFTAPFVSNYDPSNSCTRCSKLMGKLLTVSTCSLRSFSLTFILFQFIFSVLFISFFMYKFTKVILGTLAVNYAVLGLQLLFLLLKILCCISVITTRKRHQTVVQLRHSFKRERGVSSVPALKTQVVWHVSYLFYILCGHF